VKLNEMMIPMNEYHYQMMTMEILKSMANYPRLHHEENDIVDRMDNIQYSDMYDKVLFCILDVDLTNVFRDNHEQIDIFHHIYINQFRDMNDTIRFYNVVSLF